MRRLDFPSIYLGLGEFYAQQQLPDAGLVGKLQFEFGRLFFYSLAGLTSPRFQH